MSPELKTLIADYEFVAGVDEAGRGPLAGPVFAAAVILDPNYSIEGLGDSKKLSAKRREQLAIEIRAHSLAWCIASANREEIDELNILKATMLAMQRACEALPVQPGLILIDGSQAPKDLAVPVRAVVKGDAQVAAISAASILAKTARDEACLAMHERYPNYGFDQHKGYGTALHMERLNLHGPCPEHRYSFAPVRRAALNLNT